ncbi:unnamed protein product [Citrullus colocynthis]|uniref:PABS domain-containing protein n=1 Tax=Citrullus colocynthis TaxID=252529 RepID=A0ABP0XUU6_9ROSI
MLNSSKMTFQNGASSATRAQLFVPITQTDHNKPIKMVSFSPAQNNAQNNTQNGISFSPVFPEEAHVYKLENVIFKGKSQYQDLLVFQSLTHGKVVILDGSLQLAEKMSGDGGILQEISRHACVEQIDICDLDKMVNDVYDKYFPDVAMEYKDPRVNVYIGDGVAFINSVPPATYDAIIIDAFQGMGAYATELSNEALLKSIAKALKPGGVMSTPADSIWLNNFAMEDTITLCRDIFKGSPVNLLDPENFGVAKGPPKFYNSEIHTAAFCLPAFAKLAMGSKYARESQNHMYANKTKV